MKTKLTPREDIVLRTQADCYRTLLDGFVLCYSDYKYFKLIEGNTYSSAEPEYNKFKKERSMFDDINNYKVFEEKQIEWYEDIPEGGVLCWVRDSPSYVYYIDIIFSFTEKEKFIGVDDCAWNYATPLTKQEIQALLDNAPGE